MERVIFWGATGQAKVLREALLGKADVIALFDNRPLASPFASIPIFHGDDGLAEWERGHPRDSAIHACVAIGGQRGRDRLELQRMLDSRGYPPLTVVHSRAFLAADAVAGDGCQILAHASVCASSELGKAVIINTGASVDHDCRIGDGAHVAPGAILAGEVELGDFAFVGAGAVVLPRVRIGARAVIGAGAVVTRDVADDTVVVGIPARIHDNTASSQA